TPGAAQEAPAPPRACRVFAARPRRAGTRCGNDRASVCAPGPLCGVASRFAIVSRFTDPVRSKPVRTKQPGRQVGKDSMNKRVWAWASAVTMTAVMIGPGMASATGQQELEWRDCTEHLGYMDRGGLPEDVAWLCADLELPVDYENPDGRTTTVTVSKLPAQSGTPRGTVFGNPGGPGVTALDFWLPSTLGQDADMPAELH